MGQPQKKSYLAVISIGITLGLLIAIGVVYFVTKMPSGIVNKVQPAPNAQELIKQQEVSSDAQKNQQSTTTTEIKPPFGLDKNTTQNQTTEQQNTPSQASTTTPNNNGNFSKLDDKTRFEFYKILPNTEEAVNVNTNVEKVPNKKPEDIEKQVNQKLEKATESSEDTQTAKKKVTDDPEVKETLKKVESLEKPTEKEKSGEMFFIQVGAFKDKAQADILKNKVKNGLIFNGDDGLHRVRVGPFYSQESMKSARAELESKGLPANVVRIKK